MRRICGMFFFVFALILAETLPIRAADSTTDVLVKRARTQEGQGQSDLASQTWKQVLAVDPNQQDALAALALYYKRRGDQRTAQQYLDRLRRINPNSPAITAVEKQQSYREPTTRLNEATRLAANGQYDQAMRIYREVFGPQPSPAWAVAYYETEAATAGGWQSATAGLENLTKQYPDNDSYRVTLGKLYTYRPQTRAKGLLLLEAIPPQSSQAGKAREAWRQALIWSGSDPAMAPFMKSYLTRYPDADLQKSLTEATARARTSDNGPSIIRGRDEKLGYDALNGNRLGDAEKYFKLALAAAPGSPGALSGLGFVRMKQQDFDGAADYFAKAEAASPGNKSVQEALQTALFWQALKGGAKAQTENNTASAIEIYKRALAMRPSNVDALMGLAGAYMEHGDFANAVPPYLQATKLQPQNVGAWRGLINAKRQKDTPDDVISALQGMPANVQVELKKDLDYTSMMASVYGKAGRKEEARSWLQTAVGLARAKQTQLSAQVLLEIGGAYLDAGQPDQSAMVFQRATELYPSNPDAWDGLLRALVQMPDNGVKANAALQRIPRGVYEDSLKKPTFLRSLAMVYAATRRFDLAESVLQRAIDRESENGGEVSLATQLQLASVWSETGKAGNAELLLQRLVEKSPNNPDIWVAWIANLHAQKKDSMAYAEMQRIPVELLVPLSRDVNFIVLQAAVYTATGRTDEAMQAVRQAIAQYEIDKTPIPANLQIQLAWALLGDPNGQNELYSTLQSIGARRDLNPTQRHETSQIWSVWIRRRAHGEVLQGNAERAIAILRAGVQLLPEDTGIQSDLAGELLMTGDTRGAFNIYRSWGLREASPDDYAGAVGAAMAAQEKAIAAQWLDHALQLYPDNPKVLNLAAKQAIAAGDYKKAERYLALTKSALIKEAAIQSQTSAVLPVGGTSDAQSASRILGQLLLEGSVPTNRVQQELGVSLSNSRETGLSPVSPIQSRVPIPTRAPDPLFSPISLTSPDNSSGTMPADPLLPINNPLLSVSERTPVRTTKRSTAEVNVQPVSYVDSGAAQSTMPNRSTDDAAFFQQLLRSSEPRSGASFPTAPPPNLNSAGTPAALPATSPTLPLVASVAPQKTPLQEVDDQIAALQSRNTPYFGVAGLVQGRSGQGGYDRLTSEESVLEASGTINNTARVSLFVRPVFLDTGNPDGTSTLRFGYLPEGASPPAQSQSGVAADLQISTQTFGLRLGSSPQGFLVRNWIGGLRIRPANGPITFLFSRDSIKDTMLSYAGARDPATGQVWGGAISNAVQITGNWGGARSGVYVNVGYQFINGNRIAHNTRFDGGGGTYFQVLTRPQGSLTAGLNFSAMHYDKNLRYFTVGQGGYFSPQEYFLFNVPARWTGKWKEIQYYVAGSIGAQHFRENATPYFPLQPQVRGVPALYYPGQSATGPNYNLEVRADYQFSPNWVLGFFANANNARDYTAQSAGLSVRYLLRPRPVVEDLTIPSLPDWRGSPTPTFP